MSTLPTWSVVVPTRDRPRELGQVLRLLAPGAQSLDATAYEVIVTNDGDFEATDLWLNREHPHVRHVRGSRRGPAANRNAGARAARGAWLVFADDDIVPAPDWLSAYAAAADDAAVLEGRTTCEAGLHSPRVHAPQNTTGGALWSCNFAIRRELFETLGGFDEAFPYPHMEDADLRERLREAGHAMAWVPEACVDHPPRRQPSGSRLGAYRAAEVRFLYKHGTRRPVRWRILRAVILDRLVIIRRRPKGLDSLSALLALIAEFLHVAVHIRAWERDAAREFPSRPAS